MQYASTGASAERVREWVSELAHPLGGTHLAKSWCNLSCPESIQVARYDLRIIYLMLN